MPDIKFNPPWEGPPITTKREPRIRITPEATYIDGKVISSESITVVMGPREEDLSRGKIKAGEEYDINDLIIALCVTKAIS